MPGKRRRWWKGGEGGDEKGRRPGESCPLPFSFSLILRVYEHTRKEFRNVMGVSRRYSFCTELRKSSAVYERNNSPGPGTTL